ncbi:MAG: hypothetical protein SYC29_18665 [Planctomycetota bacterium]|nr:hypothetical protein [Planctomycetota bacterium]
MNRLFSSLIAMCLILALASAAAAGPSVEIRLEDGSKWRGQVSDVVQVTFLEQNVEVKLTGRLKKVADLYIMLEADVAGSVRQKTIYRGDIIAMRTLGDDDEAREAAEKTLTRRERAPAQKTGEPAVPDEAPRSADGRLLGVFYLPLEGMVGMEFRHDEIEMIGKEADKYGRGQIIVLLIDSNGGLVSESEEITDTIWDIKKRHRVVAWVKKAISAGASTAMACDEIYFMTEGTAGSVTTLMGNVSAPEELAELGVEFLAEVARRSGYSEHIARAMKLTKYECSYDKDPETGEVTFYGDTSGEFILSDREHNLTFNSSEAEKCGFSKGTADTEEELAELLDLPRWYEISTYGREIAEDWQTLVKRCQEDVRRLNRELSLSGAAPTAREALGKQIQIFKKLIGWVDRCPLPCRLMGVPEREVLERQIEELRRQLARMNR